MCLACSWRTFDLRNNPWFFRGHDELRACKLTRVLTIEKKNEAWLSWLLFFFLFLDIGYRCFLKKARNKKRFVSCLYYNEQGETGILWERREIIFNIKRNMLYIIGWDCVSNSIAGKATAFERIFPHILSKIIIDTRVCFFFLFELLRYDVGKRMCDSINTELWFWNWTTANIFFFYKDRQTV